MMWLPQLAALARLINVLRSSEIWTLVVDRIMTIMTLDPRSSCSTDCGQSRDMAPDLYLF